MPAAFHRRRRRSAAVLAAVGVLLLLASSQLPPAWLTERVQASLGLAGWCGCMLASLLLGWGPLPRRAGAGRSGAACGAGGTGGRWPWRGYRHVPGMADGPPNQRPTQWGMAVLDVIEWRRFEALVEALFQQEGFATRSQSHGADGGVDVWLYEGRKAVALVQCKHWRGRAVGVDKLRELRGVMAAQRVSRGWLVTSGYFSSEARAFARDNQINALDGRSLLERIAQRSPAQQRQLLRVALLGDYWRPTCVNCGTKMQPQRPADGSRPLWHCLPCQHSLPMRSTG